MDSLELDLLDPRVIQKRINKVLATRGEKLRQLRGSEAVVGKYYLFDTDRKVIVGMDVDIERLSIDLGVLKPGEKVDNEKRRILLEFKRTLRRLKNVEDKINRFRAKGLHPGKPGDPIALG